MLTRNFKLWLALVAVVAALVILATAPNIAQGTGLIVATLAAGAGWLARRLDEEGRTLRNVCQAYAAAIETLSVGIFESLSDTEMARFQRLAPYIKDGSEAAAPAGAPDDSLSELPDLVSHVHLLKPRAVRFIWEWRDRHKSLDQVYRLLGTREMAEFSPQRLTDYFAWARQYRDDYRDVGYSALKAIASEGAGIFIDLTRHEQAGAKELP